MSARILIVDDLPSNRRLLETRLSAEYYQVAIAGEGLEAIRLARSWQPDLILLDVMMPGMDGYETCRRLKNDPATLHIPVMMVTALGEASERLHGLEAGADDFLTKPVEFCTLLARVKSLVRLKRMLDECRLRRDTARALGLCGGMDAAPTVGGARALVVDDWDLGAEVVQDALARDGIVTGRAASEAEALALTAAASFDLITISLSLTAEDPLRLASRLRAGDATRDVPLLLIAEPEQKPRLLRGFDLGANDWLLRPVDGNELRARARNQIRRKFYQDRLRADFGTALEMALTDPLTGLHNQRYLLRHLGGLLASGSSELAVMMIDVDHFKAVNDLHGHAVGDAALKAVAETLRRRIRAFDSISRYGGEEFVVVMPGAGPQDALAAAQRLRASIEAMRFAPVPGEAHPLTISVGVAVATGRGDSPELLLQAADRAMYQAKRAGRNRVETARAPEPCGVR